MKGFIEVTETGSSKAMLINVSFICTVLQCNNKATIYMVNDNTYPWNVRESYEEVFHKIKQAMEE